MALASVSPVLTSADLSTPTSRRTSLGVRPGRGPARNADVSAHVLVTPSHVVTEAVRPLSPPRPRSPPPAVPWTRALQGSITGLWDKWQRFSAHIAHISQQAKQDGKPHPHLEMLDAAYNRFLQTISAAAVARQAAGLGAQFKVGSGKAGAHSAASGSSHAANPSAAASSATASGAPTLTPYLTMADSVEVSFAAMLSDLCNLAYEVDKVDPDRLEEKHRLSLIATSVSCGLPPSSPRSGSSSVPSSPTTASPGTSDSDSEGTAARHAASGGLPHAPTTTSVLSAAAAATLAGAQPHHHAHKHQAAQHHAHPVLHNATILTDENIDTLDAVPADVLSFAVGGSPTLSPSISLLQLTSPEAVTAALASQGHGAAFNNPVYVSTLHHALVSMGSWDDDGDIGDLEWRAAVAAAGPGARTSAAAAAAAVGEHGVGSLGTLGSVDLKSLKDVRRDGAAAEQGQGAAAHAHAHTGAAGVQQGPQAAALNPALVQRAAMVRAMQGLELQVAAGVEAAEAVGGEGAADAVALMSQHVATASIDAVQAAAAAGLRGSGGSKQGLGLGRTSSSGGNANVFFSDAVLSEERDFLAGQVYGFKTPELERHGSAGLGGEGGGALRMDAGAYVPSAVTQSGPEGGRAIREEQAARRRSSHAGEGAAGGGRSEGGAAAAAAQDEQGHTHGPPVVVACTKAPPSAWFVADDKLTKTRFFAIQGSTSMEHWQINLQFEPVVFEDAKYGVRVHRGVYEAAKVLYDDLLPLVQQHIQASPFATVSFTGHSLGGSLGVVLMLLFVVRGVLKPRNVAPCYTFGAPAVFCQGGAQHAAADRCEGCGLHCSMAGSGHHHHAHECHGAASAAAPAAEADASTPVADAWASVCAEAQHAVQSGLASIAASAAGMEAEQVLPLGLLARLGLHDDHIVNVIMHKDIVPRAFVCDYTAVAGVLQRWWPSFRDHHGLIDGNLPHKSLYNFVGRVAVVRPSAEMPFVMNAADAMHPMLPNYPALYRVAAVDDDALLPLFDHAAASLASWDDLLDGTALATAFNAMTSGCRRRGELAAAKRARRLVGMQRSVMHFMNQPHPLTTLSDYQAYGPNGCISRFHNPDNYTRALEFLSGR